MEYFPLLATTMAQGPARTRSSLMQNTTLVCNIAYTTYVSNIYGVLYLNIFMLLTLWHTLYKHCTLYTKYTMHT